jgi:hypothetical protein
MIDHAALLYDIKKLTHENQLQLALRLGASSTQVSNWLHRRSLPSPHHRRIIEREWIKLLYNNHRHVICVVTPAGLRMIANVELDNGREGR